MVSTQNSRDQGQPAIVTCIFWLSNVHELFSLLVCDAGTEPSTFDHQGRDACEHPFDRVKQDVTDLYRTFLTKITNRLEKMVVPSLIEGRPVPCNPTITGRRATLIRKLSGDPSAPEGNMADIVEFLDEVDKSLRNFHAESGVAGQVFSGLLNVINVTGFNALMVKKDFNPSGKGKMMGLRWSSEQQRLLLDVMLH